MSASRANLRSFRPQLGLSLFVLRNFGLRAACVRLQRRSILLCATVALGLVIQLSAAPAFAANETVDIVGLMQSDLRALAMGGGFGPIAQGETALLYNPAGLAQTRGEVKIRGSIIAAGEAGGFLSDTYAIAGGTPTPTTMATYFNTYLGTSQHYRSQAYDSAVFNTDDPNLGFGAAWFSTQTLALTFQDNGVAGYTAPDAGADLLLRTDRILKGKIASFAFPTANEKILWGMTWKSLSYTYQSISPSFDSLATGLPLAASAGETYTFSAYDVGMIYRMEFWPGAKPQWSLVAFNVGGLNIVGTPLGTIPYTIPATYNFGFSAHPRLPWKSVRALASIEMEDVLGTIKVRDSLLVDQNRSYIQRMHLGGEFGFNDGSSSNNYFSARVGLNRGLLSYGFEFSMFGFLDVLYTRYKDNFGYDGAKNIHAFDALQLSVGLGI